MYIPVEKGSEMEQTDVSSWGDPIVTMLISKGIFRLVTRLMQREPNLPSLGPRP